MSTTCRGVIFIPHCIIFPCLQYRCDIFWNQGVSHCVHIHTNTIDLLLTVAALAPCFSHTFLTINLESLAACFVLSAWTWFLMPSFLPAVEQILYFGWRPFQLSAILASLLLLWCSSVRFINRLETHYATFGGGGSESETNIMVLSSSCNIHWRGEFHFRFNA